MTHQFGPYLAIKKLDNISDIEVFAGYHDTSLERVCLLVGKSWIPLANGHGILGCPVIHWAGKIGDRRVMAVSPFGDSLQKLDMELELSGALILHVAAQLMEYFEHLHSYPHSSSAYRGLSLDNIRFGVGKGQFNVAVVGCSPAATRDLLPNMMFVKDLLLLSPFLDGRENLPNGVAKFLDYLGSLESDRPRGLDRLLLRIGFDTRQLPGRNSTSTSKSLPRGGLRSGGTDGANGDDHDEDGEAFRT
ncbi:hypothetical protein B0T24DRAFT_703505 [Lasiosphaeria ovina]|uniref:Uncharacterized protein n=1 Tax=Lasiosphaeria ovina TaxID=92902 RepID=A0AAE0KBG1_9PEZI|nr:hypothetical protein B0T24DRAFT_703505 [Lasiosphaeria ovina]